jgi:hypothetical protein
MDLSSLQQILDMFLLVMQFLCWLDDLLGLGIIPDEFCNFGEEEV